MGALFAIQAAGFDVALAGGFIEVSPASSLSDVQKAYLATHKAEIVDDLWYMRTGNGLVKCHDCLHFRCFNQHGRGSGLCAVGVRPNGMTWWSELLHECKSRQGAKSIRF